MIIIIDVTSSVSITNKIGKVNNVQMVLIAFILTLNAWPTCIHCVMAPNDTVKKNPVFSLRHLCLSNHVEKWAFRAWVPQTVTTPWKHAGHFISDIKSSIYIWSVLLDKCYCMKTYICLFYLGKVFSQSLIYEQLLLKTDSEGSGRKWNTIIRGFASINGHSICAQQNDMCSCTFCTSFHTSKVPSSVVQSRVQVYS